MRIALTAINNERQILLNTEKSMTFVKSYQGFRLC